MRTLGEIIPVYKPKGVTSFEVVRILRRELSKVSPERKPEKIGHAGTLDPLAEGLLIVLTGNKTKLMNEFLKLDKEYLATFRLGATSKSHDLETELVEQTPHVSLSEEQVRDALKKYIGKIEQIPPEFSATRINGKRAYKLARRGVKFELKPKIVSITELDVEEFAAAHLKVRIVCSSGTYIRSLARDIGRDLGCGAVLEELIRIRIGSYYAKNAAKLDELNLSDGVSGKSGPSNNKHERVAA
ncbi:MAG TPA: tRNA pseudouridine(55) synthase TruB [Candidatus Acidoferrales bacterium]|nr:tRNA pseudouridine(55) synthase TruB [Candidatus Acidoferrales bacterium]